MTWAIRGEPGSAPWEEKDAFGWDWEIERDAENRSIRVVVTGPARVAAERGSHDEAAEAIETEGRAAVESVLDQEDPPSQITFTTGGREDL
jgi:hypothetical protein